MYCGAAKITMNPPVGTYLSGYAAKRPCTGIHDPIHARVVAFGEQSADLLIISLDLVAVGAEYVSVLRSIIQEKYHIAPDKIMIHATHTHSGPCGTLHESSLAGKAFTIWRPYDEQLVDEQHRKILQAVGDAIQSMEPAKLYYGSGMVEGIAANRTALERVYKPDLQVLDIRKSSGNRIILYHFACHPTVLHAANLLVSADIPGAASAYLEADEQVEAALFLNGPCGDVSTRFTRQQTTFEEVDRIGRILSRAVLESLGSTAPVNASESKSKQIKLELQIRSFPSESIMQTKLEELRTTLLHAQSKDVPQAELRIMESEIEGAYAALTLTNRIGGMASVETELQVLQMGELCFVNIPGELFYETGRKIKEAFEAVHSTTHLFISGNTNDYIGYIVPEHYYTSSSYEAAMTLLRQDSSEVIVASVEKQLKILE
ncbi:neutral/alkaline non-lysosomal ceramidase N-terminal domain-containing protein [Paenibacillus frigoriresistens]|uniref:neutral/alkaline non-lysosomal ceramidase N-terminal domain-containing protein n=1 Tax=Paenibacillus alginolyticus TaxID=59839 RepID=UPI0015634765|nr:neutral/alkaline non-lysosomal ceramidase N-terminal domain-containing protein [Paenibacillus frigoriresistens]NRF94417.1 neutral/alkaline non-lysosomal ceramidase N-terminal domain-containing protein [Paenibacillus frigoriresistens]